MLEEATAMRTDYMRRMKNVEMKKKSSTNTGKKEEDDQARKVMDLSSMSLDFLPKSLLNLGAICKLDLSNNNLQNIPESLTARLLNMIVLDVRSNQLASLPNSIGCLSKLKLLNVSGNLLKSLPRTIENCRSLEELNANFNILTELPDTMGFELTNLKKLSVNSNKLAFLPSSTSHLTNLKVLDVRLNSLRSLPDDLENLYNLQTLNVSQNFHHLETLPYSIGLLINLVDLDVSYNKIRALPESIGCLRKIQKLSVEGNPLVSPPPEVMEQGIIVVKEYLCYKMNNGLQAEGSGSGNNTMKKKSWFGKLARCTTFGGSGSRKIREEVFIPKSNSIGHGVLASPRYMGMFSPKRLASPRSMGMFSPKRFFSPKSY